MYGQQFQLAEQKLRPMMTNLWVELKLLDREKLMEIDEYYSYSAMSLHSEVLLG